MKRIALPDLSSRDTGVNAAPLRVQDLPPDANAALTECGEDPSNWELWACEDGRTYAWVPEYPLLWWNAQLNAWVMARTADFEYVEG